MLFAFLLYCSINKIQQREGQCNRKVFTKAANKKEVRHPWISVQLSAPLNQRSVEPGCLNILHTESCPCCLDFYFPGFHVCGYLSNLLLYSLGYNTLKIMERGNTCGVILNTVDFCSAGKSIIFNRFYSKKDCLRNLFYS